MCRLNIASTIIDSISFPACVTISLYGTYIAIHILNTACPPFTFNNTLSNTDKCQPYPMFSNTTDEASAVCPCNPGYFRSSDGIRSEDTMPCTRKHIVTVYSKNLLQVI